MGGKYKLLSQILQLFPNDVRTFVDLFGGGGNVCINVNSKHTIYNDAESHVVDLMRYFAKTGVEVVLSEIKELIARFNLSKENADGYRELRDYYNAGNNNPIVFYTLICYAFNYQIRFNNAGKFNMPFGKNRSSFNPILERKLINFVNELHNKDVSFYNCTFDTFDFGCIGTADFVYCDPPYFNSVATYNENGGWSAKDEVCLLDVLSELDKRGVRWALSNNLKYENPILDKWKDKYNIHYLNVNYQNCNYQKKDKSKDIEVLITNYDE